MSIQSQPSASGTGEPALSVGLVVVTSLLGMQVLVRAWSLLFSITAFGPQFLSDPAF